MPNFTTSTDGLSVSFTEEETRSIFQDVVDSFITTTFNRDGSEYSTSAQIDSYSGSIAYSPDDEPDDPFTSAIISNDERRKLATGIKLYPIEQMPDKPLGTWLFNKYAERRSVDAAAEIVTSAEGDRNGGERLAEELFVAAAEDMEERFEDGNERASAFNTVTIDWPHEMRMRMAGYLLEHSYSWATDDELFQDELLSFAADGGFAPDNDLDLIPSGVSPGEDEQLGENPYNRDGLSDEMAAAHVLAWANGNDPSPIENADISDPDDFRWWIEKTGDLDTAIRAHHFGKNVPIDVVSEAAAPDEWEHFDPVIEEREYECDECRTRYYEIETPDGVGSVSSLGERTLGEKVKTVESDVFYSEHPATICPECKEELLDFAVGRSEDTLIVHDEDSNVGVFTHVSNFIVDNAATDAMLGEVSPFPHLSEEAMRGVRNYPSGGVLYPNNPDPIQIASDNGNAASGDLIEAFNSLLDSPEEIAGYFDDLVFIEQPYEDYIQLLAPPSNPNAVCQAKEFAQNPTDVINV